MDQNQIEKNILDLKYNAAVSFAIKSLGAGITLLVGLLGIGASTGAIKLYTMIGISIWIVSIAVYTFFKTRSDLYLKRLRNLE